MTNVTEIRTTLNLPAKMAEAIDDYWHAERFSSRNGAIRDLLAYALNTLQPRLDKEQPRVVTPGMIERIRVAQTKVKRP